MSVIAEEDKALWPVIALLEGSDIVTTLWPMGEALLPMIDGKIR